MPFFGRGRPRQCVAIPQLEAHSAAVPEGAPSPDREEENEHAERERFCADPQSPGENAEAFAGAAEQDGAGSSPQHSVRQPWEEAIRFRRLCATDGGVVGELVFQGDTTFDDEQLGDGSRLEADLSAQGFSSLPVTDLLARWKDAAPQGAVQAGVVETHGQTWPLAPLSAVASLDLRSNCLETLPPCILDGITFEALVRLSANANWLSDLAGCNATRCVQLRILKLQQNRLENDVFGSNGLLLPLTLTELDLSYNRLSAVSWLRHAFGAIPVVPVGSALRLSQLKTLRLSGNRLASLQGLDEGCVPQLAYCALADNPLELDAVCACGSLCSLDFMNLADCRLAPSLTGGTSVALKALSSQAQRGWPILRELWLDGNVVTKNDPFYAVFFLDHPALMEIDGRRLTPEERGRLAQARAVEDTCAVLMPNMQNAYQGRFAGERLRVVKQLEVLKEAERGLLKDLASMEDCADASATAARAALLRCDAQAASVDAPGRWFEWEASRKAVVMSHMAEAGVASSVMDDVAYGSDQVTRITPLPPSTTFPATTYASAEGRLGSPWRKAQVRRQEERLRQEKADTVHLSYRVICLQRAWRRWRRQKNWSQAAETGSHHV